MNDAGSTASIRVTPLKAKTPRKWGGSDGMRCAERSYFMPLLRRLVVSVLALTLGLAGCSSAEVDEDANEEGQSAEAFTDSKGAVETPWGTDMFHAQPDGKPNASWPGVFDQPAMTSGPGSCGFTAIANLSTQMLSTRGQSAQPITPWDALGAKDYNTVIGIYPSTVIKLLDGWFAGEELAGDLAGTKFVWAKEGAGHADRAWARLRSNLDAGHPFIALINYGEEGAPSYFNCSHNHYVTVVAVTADESVVIAHWGGYETVAKARFLKWWENHCVYSYSGIYPSNPSRLGEPRRL